MRRLVVNADDFGLSDGVNRGVASGHEHGIVTSASLMVRWPAARAAVAYAAEHPKLSLGLHLDLGESIYCDGSWHELYKVVPSHDVDAVAAEVAWQLAAFRALTGRDPTHIDSHQHVHREEPVRTAMLCLSEKLDVPLRGESSRIRFCGDFYGQTGRGERVEGGVDTNRLLAILSTLPPGATELGCHPGDGHDLYSPYQEERAVEVRTLCEPRVRQALEREQIDLITFHDL
jgi:chitin disaccharide deacetylase